MNDTSRRKFLAAAGVGTAGAVGLTAVTAGQASAAQARARATEPVVAFVENPRSDKVVLMFGEQEVEVRDRDLAARILAAAGGN